MPATTVPAIPDLVTEIMDRIKSVPSFGDYSYSIFDADDLNDQSSYSDAPAVGVMYDGATPTDNEAESRTKNAKSTTLIALQFSLVLIIKETTGLGAADAKLVGVSLLDEVRSAMLGFRGVNIRPWRFVDERPRPEIEVDGLRFYTQTWATTIPFTGNHSNQGFV